MSVIHRALSRADREPVTVATGYNPLSSAQATPKRQNRTVWLAGGLLTASLLVIFWPESITPQASDKIPGSNPTTIKRQDQTAPSAQVSSAQEDNTPAPTVTPEPVTEETLALLRPEPAATDEPESVSEFDIASPASTVPDNGQSVAESSSKPADDAPSDVTPDSTDLAAVTPNTESPPVTPSPVAESAPEATQTSSATIIRRAEDQWQSRIEAALERGAIEEAEADLKRWIGAQPGAERPRLWLAKIYINNGVYVAAEPLLQSLESSEALALIGVVYERTERYAQAADLFEKLYRSQPFESQWLLFWAINSENSQQLAKARQLYQTYLEQFSQEDEALRQFAAQRLQIIGAI